MEKYYRYFGGFIKLQEKWINKIASKGLRLTKVEKILYEFDKCDTNKYQYCVEFVGEKAKDELEDYKKNLEKLGYKVFYKNINWNYSIGKMKYRPWVNKGEHIATNATIYNKELMIIEKKNDGLPFEIHTELENKIKYYCKIKTMWEWLFALFGILGIMCQSIVGGVFAVCCFLPVIYYDSQVRKEGK